MWHSSSNHPAASPARPAQARPAPGRPYQPYRAQTNQYPPQQQQQQSSSSYPSTSGNHGSTAFPMPSPYSQGHGPPQQTGFPRPYTNPASGQARPPYPVASGSSYSGHAGRPPPISSPSASYNGQSGMPRPGPGSSYPSQGGRPPPSVGSSYPPPTSRPFSRPPPTPSMSMPAPAHWSPSPPLQHSPHPQGPDTSRPRPASQDSYNYFAQPTRPVRGPVIPPHPHSQGLPSPQGHTMLPSPLPKDPYDDDADLQAALAASQQSAQKEAELRRATEAEEMRRLEDLHRREQADRQRREAERQREEEAQMRLVMEQSREEELRREQEAREREARAVEESRVHAAREAIKRAEEEEEHMRQVMEASLKEEWERRREAEEEEVRMVERIRREIEEQQAASSASSSRPTTAGPSGSSGSGGFQHVEPAASSSTEGADSGRIRRPLPVLPPIPQSRPSSEGASVPAPGPSKVPLPDPQSVQNHEQPLPNEDRLDDNDDRDDPFADAAEAPPAYDHIGADRPPEAPSRAPTGFWDEARARRIREQRAANGGRPEPETTPHVPTDPLEEKRRMEALGRRDPAPDGSAGGSSTVTRKESERATHPRQPGSNSQDGSKPTPALSNSPGISRPDVAPVQNGHSPAGSAGSGQYPVTPGHGIDRQSSRSSVASTASRFTATSSRSNSMTGTARTRQTSATGDLSVPSRVGKGREGSRSPSVSELGSGRPSLPGQKAPIGIDWGYSDTAFATKLRPGPREHFMRRTGSSEEEQASSSQDSMTEQEEALLKSRFPGVISLSSTRARDASEGGSSISCPYFTVRCGSWKILLRSLAWLGNTRIEAAPQAVADAAENNRIPLLRMEVEFVTPASRKGSNSDRFSLQVDPTRSGAEEVAAKARQRIAMRPTACVSICMSLCQQDAKGHVHRTQGTGSTGSNQAYHDGARTQAERELDMGYLKRGSDRRVLNLPPSSMGIGPVTSAYSMTYQANPAQVAKETRAGLDLPTTLVELAQHLQKAHRFSASCPSSGYTARHSPRDLYHIIEAHDEKWLGKLQKESASQAAGGNAGLVYSYLPTDGSANGTEAEERLLPLSSVSADGPPLVLWDESSLGHSAPTGSSSSGSGSGQNPLLTSYSYNSLSTGGGGGDIGLSNGLPDGSERSGLGRMKDRVKKKLKGRQGDVGEGEELANWITPLDLSEVGGGEEAGDTRTSVDVGRR
ncbi:hypothetical protein BCV69DRAFT_283858 [Microstroma glucosiphilum]|uniref:Uncharacterized protein n=1 Tax=Pseudomicrostroma glucosiphilum TaxID=1684307 RepID=A0A316U3C6_9BASI|nr:hypothetical protein BCV69DRAFT_283858 [Pseudomicrostroma glucosiphilum]PWN19757.1 hypothetical protein BCV69DRAFT_283858 [Pseudomicrostroma glucosiphilum]